MEHRALRQPVQPQRRRRSVIGSVIAPVSGLVLNRSPADPDPRGAEVLTNWIPTQRGVRVRGGLRRVANVGAPVVSVFSYQSPTNPAIFAATASEVYDISALDPVNVPTADLTGQGAGYYSTQQIGTVGGDFLYIVNGADNAQLYDGSTWTLIDGGSTPSITNVSTDTLSHVWLYRSRLFFVQKNTLSAWYLPVDSVGGAASEVSLAGVFQRGGSLLFGATWSLDSGDGIDDKAVFVSTEGEVAIFEGANPGSASDWRLVGLYDIAKPLGIKGTMQAGGDLLIATTDGIVPLSQVIVKDPAALSLSAVSRPVETLWSLEAGRAIRPVELVKWASEAIGLVVLPDAGRSLVVNLQTGAWALQSGWSPTCADLFLDRLFGGFEDGYVKALDETGLDDGVLFTAQYCHSFGDGGDPTTYKRGQMSRFTFFAPSEFQYRSGMSFDYTPEFGTAPNAAESVVSSDFLIWDTGNWDEKLWWSSSEEEATQGLVTQWRTVSGAGYTLAPTLQITSGFEEKLNIELIRTDIAYEVGGAVV